MPLINNIHPQFHTGQKIVSLIFHPPEIENGTWGTVVSTRVGKLYAVQLPDGSYYTWLADFELQPVDPRKKILQVEDFAKVLTEEGHTPEVKKDMIVKIQKITDTIPFYDVMVRDVYYHRWFDESEIIPL